MNPKDNWNLNPKDNWDINLEPPKIDMEIETILGSLRYLCNGLKNTRDPTWLSLATSLEEITSSIPGSQGELANISNFRARMFEYYRTGLRKEKIRDRNISNKQLMTCFIIPRNGLNLSVTNKHIYMDWCSFQPFKDHRIYRLFMVFDKTPCNYRDVSMVILKVLRIC